jgi:hypothetical protein
MFEDQRIYGKMQAFVAVSPRAKFPRAKFPKFGLLENIIYFIAISSEIVKLLLKPRS